MLRWLLPTSCKQLEAAEASRHRGVGAAMRLTDGFGSGDSRQARGLAVDWNGPAAARRWLKLRRKRPPVCGIASALPGHAAATGNDPQRALCVKIACLSSGDAAAGFGDLHHEQRTDQAHLRRVLRQRRAKSDKPVLVDYWAEWCGPCKMIAPILDEVSKDYDGRLQIAKMNVDENRDVPAKFGIRGIPTLMLFKGGQLAATKVGALTKAQLTAFIDGSYNRLQSMRAPSGAVAGAPARSIRHHAPTGTAPKRTASRVPVDSAYSPAFSSRSCRSFARRRPTDAAPQRMMPTDRRGPFQTRRLASPRSPTHALSRTEGACTCPKLIKQGEALEIENVGRMRKQELMFAIMKKRAKAGEQVFADGVLEVLPDGFGFLRSPDASYTASHRRHLPVSPSQIRRFNLHTGDMIEGEVRMPKDGERYFALDKLDKVNGVHARGEQAQDHVREPDAAVPEGAVQARTRHQGRREHHQPHHRPHRAASAKASAPCWWRRPRAARR